MQLTEAQARLLPLLAARLSTGAIAGRLGCSRQRVCFVVDELMESGIVGQWREFPAGATSTTWPSDVRVRAARAALRSTEASHDAIRKLVRDQSRAGLAMPVDHDDQRTRSQWAGHLVRRVQWRRQGRRWVVQGLLVPRADGIPWDKAAPTYRAVVVSDGGEDWVSLGLLEHQLIVPVSMICRLHDGWPDVMYRDVTLAVAWVLESRALLDGDL